MSSSINVLSITTPLPESSFDVLGLSGAERLSRPFEYYAELGSGKELLDPNSLLDNPVTISLGDPDQHGRYIHGIVRSVKQMPATISSQWCYTLTVVPKLWFLGQTQDCRFYHNQTVPDIVKAILDKFGITYSSKLQGSYTAREYTVQFNESYLDFIQRIMEDEGIFYFFDHSQSDHGMILGDSKTVFPSIGTPNVEVHTQGSNLRGLTSWSRADSTAIGDIKLDDYNPATDQLSPGVTRGHAPTVLKASGASSRTYYAWPAVRGTKDDATAKAKWRIQASEAAAQLYSGAGGARDFVPGGKFTLSNDPVSGSSTDYVIHSVSYSASDTASGAGGGAVSQINMNCAAFPASADWREEPSVAAPVMAGLYTALVIGPDGEEIYVDDSGRIKVQFPWDNNGDITSDNTFWARVVQPWAGNVWGTQFIPRIGMEVAVAFLEGDVNRPVVVGSMYNSQNAPIFAAADKTKSGIRTRSTKGGGASAYNEFSFDDKMGSELFFLHAEKDYTLEVEHDQTLKIDNCRIVTVTKDETVTINGKQAITVKGDHAMEVSTGNHSVTIDQGNQNVTVTTGNRALKVSTGNETLDVSLGAITHKAMQSITLQVGGNSLKIDPTGITLTGTMITITGNAMLKMDSPLSQLSGDGMLKLAGGIVMVN